MTQLELSPFFSHLLRLTPHLVELRHRLHAYPELSWQETETTALLLEQLGQAGLDCHVGPTGTGLIADLVVSKGAPFLAFRADIDALPIAEHTDEPRLPRSSVAGVMHACGHDVHTAVALGAALVLAKQPDGLRHNMRFIFEPAEEVAPGGAIDMVRHGAMQDVRAIAALHVDPTLALGRVGIRAGAMTAAVDSFELMIYGSGGHSARPHEAVDPLLLGMQLVSQLYQQIPRRLDARDPCVVSVCRFRAGNAPNVIPDMAEIAGTCRTFSLDVRDGVMELIRQIAEHTVAPAGGRCEMRIQHGSPPILNDGRLAELATEEVTNLLGAEAVHHVERPSMGGEDFSEFLVHAPGLMFRLGTRTDQNQHQLHSSHFVVDDRAIGIGTKVVLALLLRLDREL